MLLASWRPLAYAVLAVVATRFVVLDFLHARKREPAHGEQVLPLVTRERAQVRAGPWEVRVRGHLGVRVQGLAFTEMLAEEPDLWRHGLAASTVVTVAPRPEVARLEYTFDNPRHVQAMTIRVGGREVETRNPLPEGRSSGVITVPGSTEALPIEFAFAGWSRPPPSDERLLTVTFRKLSLVLP